MDVVEVVVEFELSEEVSAASRFSLSVQLAEVISKAIEEKELEVPDGEIEDFVVDYDVERF
jgi:hypothetical protein